ncbi:MAG: D-cysteine desulfhydrase family protein [Candidatus Hydrothermales bacterium]
MEEVVEKLKVKKIDLAWKPTPIELLKEFPHHASIYIKRDDYTGLITSGNKIRKLEYAIFDAKQKNCDTLITCGALQSNHCRATAYAGKKEGFEVHLVLRGEPKEYQGNLLLDHLFGAKIKYVSYEDYKERINEILEEVAEDLKKKDKKPYIIPEGASNEVGCLGYVECMDEMKKFIKEEKIEAIYLAVGSGGTYAGLLIGKKLLKLDVRIIGIIVCDSIKFFKGKIEDICEKAIKKYNLPIEISPSDIELIDGYIGEGYGIPYKEEIELIKKISENYGIILDPVYTGKAFYGMLNESKKFKRILFLHTGGIFSIFAYNRELTQT